MPFTVLFGPCPDLFRDVRPVSQTISLQTGDEEEFSDWGEAGVD
jgi:hypothetical protein